MIRRIESDALTIERGEDGDLTILDRDRSEFAIRIEYDLVPELLLALEALYPND